MHDTGYRIICYTWSLDQDHSSGNFTSSSFIPGLHSEISDLDFVVISRFQLISIYYFWLNNSFLLGNATDHLEKSCLLEVIPLRILDSVLLHSKKMSHV